LFSKACDRGNGEGCYKLGNIYDAGQGVRQDSFKVVKLYTKACDLAKYEFLRKITKFKYFRCKNM
jgi:TPR repeat protein